MSVEENIAARKKLVNETIDRVKNSEELKKQSIDLNVYTEISETTGMFSAFYRDTFKKLGLKGRMTSKENMMKVIAELARKEVEEGKPMPPELYENLVREIYIEELKFLYSQLWYFYEELYTPEQFSNLEKRFAKENGYELKENIRTCEFIQKFVQDFVPPTKVLNLEKNKENIPEGIKLLDLKGIKLCELKEIPLFIFDIKNLTYIEISYSKFKELPPNIGELKQLEFIKLHSNKEFITLPKEISQCENLKQINLDGCSISSLPEELKNCSKLTSLSLMQNNNLKSLPVWLKDCPSLKNITLSKSDTVKIPEELKKLEIIRL